MSKRVDANHSEIVRGLREIGATVQSLAALGKGAPDLLCGHRGRNYLFEIKNPLQPPSKRKLTDAEKDWHERWRGSVHTILNFSEALEIITSRAEISPE
jgi:hypothetical protein